MMKNLVSSDENITQILTDMNDALRRADTIIMDLLNFAAPRELDLRPHSLRDLLEQSIGLVRHELNASGVKLVREIDPRRRRCWWTPTESNRCF